MHLQFTSYTSPTSHMPEANMIVSLPPSFFIWLIKKHVTKHL